jgi:hypothetical protein
MEALMEENPMLGQRYYFRGRHVTVTDTRRMFGEFQVCLVPDGWTRKRAHWTHWIPWRLLLYRLNDGSVLPSGLSESYGSVLDSGNGREGRGC